MIITDVLQKHNIPFRVSGNDAVIKCLNPEHDDLNPSMRVDLTTGAFNCFSCGFKGLLLSHFNEEYSKLGLLRNKLSKSLKEARSLEIGYNFPEDAMFLKTSFRGISSRTITRFNLFTSETLGPDRVFMPIYTPTGKLSSFIGRSTSIAVSPKYLFTPKLSQKFPYPVENNSELNLVEGPFDMLKMHDAGITNTACCFGTSISPKFIDLLGALHTRKINIFFDGDDRGQQAAEKAISVLESHGFYTENIYIKDKDPGELTQNFLKDLYEKRTNSRSKA